MTWIIQEHPRFQADVISLGGFSYLWQELELLYDGLRKSPYGFTAVDGTGGLTRFVKTKAHGNIPDLLFIFDIDVSAKTLTLMIAEIDLHY